MRVDCRVVRTARRRQIGPTAVDAGEIANLDIVFDETADVKRETLADAVIDASGARIDFLDIPAQDVAFEPIGDVARRRGLGDVGALRDWRVEQRHIAPERAEAETLRRTGHR